MENMSRRSFMQKGSLVVGAAGVAAAAPGLLSKAREDKPAGRAAGSLAAAAPARSQAAVVEQRGADTPIVARVRDVRTGEIDIFVGQRRITIHDAETAGRLVDAAR